MLDLRAEMFNREAREGSDAVIEKLNIKEGDIIADIGSGGGYFVFEFSKNVGAAGKVYAVDTDSALLNHISKRIVKESTDNIEIIEAKEDDPALPPSGCDLIFMRNVFHHIKNPKNYFKRLKESLKPGGRIAVIDWKPEARHGHGTSEKEVINAFNSAGYRRIETYDFLKKQSFNIFETL